METIIFLSVITVLMLVGIALSIVLIRKSKNTASGIISDKLGIYEKKLELYEKNLKDEFALNRKETSESTASSRKENTETLMKFQDSINGKFDTLTKNTQDSMTNGLTKFMDTLSRQLENLTKTTQETLNHQQQSVQTSLKTIQ